MSSTVAVWLIAACGSGNVLAREIGEQVARNEDDVVRIVARESDRSGVPAGTVEERWLARLRRPGAREIITSPAADFLCSNLTGVLGSTDAEPDRVVVLLKIGLGNLAAENPTTGGKLLADDIKETLANIEAGRPHQLELFFLRNFSCDLVGRAWQ